MLRRLTGLVLGVAMLSAATAAQDANAVLASVSKAMGVENVTSVTFSGTAADVNFLQTVNINGPWPLRPITGYTRTINLAEPAMRSSGQTNNVGLFGGAPVAGTHNQNVNPNAQTWGQQLDYWVTPWGFLRGAAANKATVTTQQAGGRPVTVVSWTPPMKAPSGASYRVNGYIGKDNLLERVETWVEHDMLGDMHVDTTYSDYKDFGGVKVPTKMTQKRGGSTFFEITVASAQANPANLTELLTPPGRGGGAPGGGGRAGAPRAGGPPAAAAPGGGAPRAGGPGGAPGGAPGGGRGGGAQQQASTKLADGVYQITGAYNALAVEFRDYVVVVEAGQSIARGQAILDEVKRILPGKPIRYVVNSHPHSDHASGLAPFVAEGATIVTAQNNVKFFQDTFSNPRTLVGDALAKNPRKPMVEGVGAKRVFEDGTRSLEIIHIIDSDPEKVHSDGIVVAYLPKERILFQADFSLPNAGQQANPFVQSLAANLAKMKIDFDTYLPVHNAPNPQTKADLMKATGVQW